MRLANMSRPSKTQPEFTDEEREQARQRLFNKAMNYTTSGMLFDLGYGFVWLPSSDYTASSWMVH